MQMKASTVVLFLLLCVCSFLLPFCTTATFSLFLLFFFISCLSFLFFLFNFYFFTLIFLSVYVGAVLVLFLFVFMFIGANGFENIKNNSNEKNLYVFLVFFIFLVLIFVNFSNLETPLESSNFPSPFFINDPFFFGTKLIINYSFAYMFIGFLFFFILFGVSDILHFW